MTYSPPHQPEIFWDHTHSILLKLFISQDRYEQYCVNKPKSECVVKVKYLHFCLEESKATNFGLYAGILQV